MSSGILSHAPKTRKLAKSLTEKIGTQHNGRNGNGTGPKYRARDVDAASMARDGYVKSSSGWLRREFVPASELAELDAAADAAKAPATIYDLAQDAIGKRRGSFPAENVHIGRHGELKIHLTRTGEEVYLLAVGPTGQTEKTRAAWLSPLSGWSFCCATWDYKNWVARCQAIA